MIVSLFYRRRQLLSKDFEETYTTTLFTDGTFIINEKSSNRAANVALHGAVINEYWPLDKNHPYVFTSASDQLWYTEKQFIKSIEFGSEVKPTSLGWWFQNLTNLSSFDSTNLNTNNVSIMQAMFYQCTSLVSLDISSWNTANNTNFRNMFYGCTSLTTLILPEHFVTSSCTTLESTFDACSSLTSIDVSNWDVSGCDTLMRVFRNCTSLTSLDLSNWNTANATSMRSMFDTCSSLTSLDVSNFDTSNVTDMYNLFNNCSFLTSLDLSNFDMSNVTTINRLVASCSNLTSLVIGTIDGNYSSITNSGACFRDCLNLASITINGLSVLPLTSSSALNNLKLDCQIKVPASLVNDYKTATNWSSRASYISAI